VGIEVDEGDWPEPLPGHPEQRVGDGMVAADRQQLRGPGQQPARGRLDLVDSLLDVEWVARDVARVRDLLGAERRYPQAGMPRAQQP